MSYWVPTYEDYDGYFLSKLQTIKVDLNGDGVLQPINVTFFTPEHEGNEDIDLLRPAIVIFLYDQVPDIKREQTIKTHITSDTPTDTVINNTPTPMKLFYQFTILTDYQSHLNEIMRQFNKMFPTRGYISVESPTEELYHYDFFQKNLTNGYTNQFLQYGANEQQRIFRKIYTYHLYTEIDDSQGEKSIKKVRQEINTTITEITE